MIVTAEMTRAFAAEAKRLGPDALQYPALLFGAMLAASTEHAGAAEGVTTVSNDAAAQAGYVAAMDTAKRLLYRGHQYSAGYVGMAIFQDGLLAYTDALATHPVTVAEPVPADVTALVHETMQSYGNAASDGRPWNLYLAMRFAEEAVMADRARRAGKTK